MRAISACRQLFVLSLCAIATSSVTGCCARKVSFALGADVTTGQLEGKVDIELRSDAECRAYKIMAQAMDAFAIEVNKCLTVPDPLKCREIATTNYKATADIMYQELQRLQGLRGFDVQAKDVLAELTRLRDRYLASIGR